MSRNKKAVVGRGSSYRERVAVYVVVVVGLFSACVAARICRELSCKNADERFRFLFRIVFMDSDRLMTSTVSTSGRSRFRRFLALFGVLSVVVVIYAWYSGWLGTVAYQLLIGLSRDTSAKMMLESFQVGIEAKPMQGVGRNASGLTYHPGRNTLFSVINRPAQVIELTLDGRLLRTLPVKGVDDLEGITHVRGDAFFLADEQTQRLIHVNIGGDQTEIDTRRQPGIRLAFDLDDNLGFEGVSWDHRHDRLFVVKEKSPLRLFEVSGLTDLLDGKQLNLEISEWLPRGSSRWLLRDLSSLTYREESENMLLLSDESHLIVELDPQRRPAGLLVLRRGWHGLQADVPQAEGIAVGPGGQLFVVSEPNLLYRFDPPHGH